MLNANDLNTWAEDTPIAIGTTIGMLRAEYRVEAYTRVANLKRIRGYLVSSQLRIVIANSYVYEPTGLSGYTNYPAAIKNFLAPAKGEPGLQVTLLEYFPKTINTAVNISQNSSAGTSDSYMSQYSSGSSVAQTNTYEVSASLTSGFGFMGPAPTGDVSSTIGAAYSTSETRTQSQEHTQGQTSGRDAQSGLSASMSMKDWASYAKVDKANESIEWLWGQEYPWNVLEVHKTTPGSATVELPAYVRKRLWDETEKQLYPPSQLSLYGVNFHSRAKWLVLPSEAGDADETLQFTHWLDYYTATHEIKGVEDKNVLHASMNYPGRFEHTSEALNLPVLGLDPIAESGADNGALLGFSKLEFIRQPSAGSRFRILSGRNNLYVAGTGFALAESADAIMHATLAGDGSAQITILFKLLANDLDLSLYLRHWKTAQRGCQLSIDVNGLTPSSMIRHVDAFEASDGDSNTTVIILRNRNYAAGEYFNYLLEGLNTIVITIRPSSMSSASSSDCGYAIRALAIG